MYTEWLGLVFVLVYLTLSAKGWSVSISDLHLVACVILCSSWPLKISGMSESVLLCNLH